jgi:N-acetyl-anhydromuramyl-L-alanine amidase AmpD
MSVRSFASRPAVLTASLLAAASIVATPALAQPVPVDQQRQQAFVAAAREFGVPESVLLGVSYLESRWDANAGTPSTSAGYGPMHLTDVRTAGAGTHHDEGAEDARGDDARPALPPRAPQPGPPPASLQTLDLAARLTGADPRVLRTDPVQNIRGGAAVLAGYQRTLAGGHGRDAGPAQWYGAVARYSGATEARAATAFADEVFATIASGMDRTTDDGQHVRLAPAPHLRPERTQADALGLRAATPSAVECPESLSCESVPAPYQELPGGGYGNHDIADRPRSQQVEYLIIHDTESTWDSTLKAVQDPDYVSWHYSLRSADGHIAQHVPTKDVAWHAGNWYVNSKSIGLEHEGFAKEGTWYTEAMYRTSAKLVRYLAGKYHIPLDRSHILGHANVPGTTPATIKGMHWDPGPYWDWAHYFTLLGAPLDAATSRSGTGLVTIDPDFDANRPTFTGCTAVGTPCPARGSSALLLHTEPRPDAPLLTDAGLHPDGSPSTVDVADTGSRVETGQRYAVAEVRGDWTAIWYLGQKGWFANPGAARTAAPARGTVATPAPGVASVPVYGRAYPEAGAYPAGIAAQELVPLPYTFAGGQRYAAGPVVGSEYFSATTFDPASHVVVRGRTRYVQIQFGHRVAFVNAADVRLAPAD